jgi:hypothetical protein
MGMISSRGTRNWGHDRRTASSMVVTLATSLAIGCQMNDARADEPGRPNSSEASFRFPTVRPGHRHARDLLANAMRYLAPENRMIDPASGYPFEGWNQDPVKGLYLRSFTQLTAIGLCMELLANVAAGVADTPYLSREQAVSNLTRLVQSLREDQRDPRLSAGNLLGNFLDLATGKRLGPLTSEVEKQKFFDTFGREKGEAIWKALLAKGWIVSQNQGREGAIFRSARYGWDYFDGVLSPFGDNPTKQRILAILDERVVLVVFIDNANLSASCAKSIGALSSAGIKDRPEIAELRQKLEDFLERQREGYTRLYDAKAGQFYFGWDATKDRLFGWADLQGKWTTGHVDYLVNEFRGPATFIVARFGLPLDAIRNLGFKMKPYRMRDGRDKHVLAPWEGSAFQALGLELSMTELARPSWRRLLEDVVDVEIDYAARRNLPGFLSESYSGTGVEYTGYIGIPEITVSPRPRVTDAASLYTLGAAYTVSPEKIERFLAANWSVVSRLLTDHGPWEGLQTTRQEVIQFQTTAHTFSLILGLLSTASDHMKRYLDSKGLGEKLEDIFRPGEGVELFPGETQIFAWDDKGVPIQSTRERDAFHVTSARVSNAGIALVSTRPDGVNLSGGQLSLRYRSAAPIDEATIALKPAGSSTVVAGLISTEIFCRFVDTRGRQEEIQVPLPATPGLARTKEVVITFGAAVKGRALDLSITGLRITPIAPTDRLPGTETSRAVERP